MTNSQKSKNRWLLTRRMMEFVGAVIVALLVLAAFGNTEAVEAMRGIVYCLIGFSAALQGVNMATPAGGFTFKREDNDE